MVTRQEMHNEDGQRIEHAEGILDILYESYASKANGDNGVIQECLSELKACTKQMPFAMIERIHSAAIAMCVECERMAFMDGVTLGVKLILELMNR